MNPIHPKKLLLSKWTATRPQAKDKHFLVTRVIHAVPRLPQASLAGAEVEAIELEAVMSKRSQRIDWRELRDSAQWRQGWL
jgi:tryptophan-rich hypothetical protein